MHFGLGNKLSPGVDGVLNFSIYALAFAPHLSIQLRVLWIIPSTMSNSFKKASDWTQEITGE